MQRALHLRLVPGATDEAGPEVAPRDNGLRRLLGYWNTQRRDRRFPARRDLDPLDFVYVLGWVMLIDVEHRPLRFHYRLHGSEIASRTDLDMTGKSLAEHPDPEYRALTHRQWAETVACGAPTLASFYGCLDDRFMHYESLRLPLSSDGDTIDMLLVAARHW